MRDALVAPLIAAALRGAVVLLAALVLTTLLHRRSAATRHAIWAGAVAAQLLLLALAVWGPRWRIEAPEVLSALVPAGAGDAIVAPPRIETPPARRGVAEPATVSPTTTAPSTTAEVQADRASSPTPAAPIPRRGPSLSTLLVTLWALGAAAVLLRLGAGTLVVARLARRGARVDDGGWLSLAQRLAATLRIDRPLTLLRGDRLGVPVTWGIVYPVVLLPEDADAWPDERRRYVLVHEMAHVKRLDALTQLVGQLALAVFWFNPLMWIAVRRMQLEREHACDDYVLRHGTQPSRYAEDLFEMVRSLGTPEHRAAQPAFAALAMARRTEFEGRMLSILDPVLDRHPLSRGRTLMSALASLLVIVPLAALQPYRAVSAMAQSDSPVPRSSSSSASRTSDGDRTTDDGRKEARADAPLSQQLQAPDSTRRATATFDSSTAHVVGRGVATSSSTSSVSHEASASSDGSGGHEDSCDRFRPGNSSNTQFHMHADDDAGRNTIRYLDFNEGHCRQANINGKLVTSDNEDHVLMILPRPDGRAYFRERTGSIDRELTITFGRVEVPASAAGGRAMEADGNVFLYRVNGAERPYDDEGRRWLATLLPRVLAEAAVNVEPRVKYWRSQGGADNALRHIAELRSSGAKRAHYDALLETPLSARELDRVVAQAGKDIPSSGDLRAVLAKAASQTGGARVSPATIEAAAGAVPSSGDLTAVLLAFGRTDDREQLLAVARTALKIPSSGDLSRFLIEVAPRYLGREDRALRDGYFNAVAKVPSSGDVARVLVNAVPFAATSTELTQAIITAARAVPASGDRARVLVALARSGALRTTALRDRYLEAASAIPAAGDMRLALEALTRN